MTETADHMPTHRTLNLIGWLLFIGSAIGFLVVSWGDFWGMVGSLLFLLACLVFLIPFFTTDDINRPDRENG
ncbi:MAG: cytochrome oxidase subunit III [Pseudomonadota bacterium]